MRFFCETFEEMAAEMGLHLSVPKCEAVPAAGSAFSVSQDLFPGWRWLPGSSIKLLGAPVDSAAFCAELTAKRVGKADELLSRIDKYGHSQVALLLLRHCASWSKLVYVSRTVPPALHLAALESYGFALRKSLGKLVGDGLTELSWALAQLGIAQVELGIRDPARHDPAAYLASLCQSRELCGSLDAGFDAEDTSGGSFLAETERELRALVLEGASWDRGEVGVSRKDLSGMLDAAAIEQLKWEHSQDATFHGHVGLCRLTGAGAWLTANPVEDGREIDAPLFKVALKRRLRMRILDEDAKPVQRRSNGPLG